MSRRNSISKIEKYFSTIGASCTYKTSFMKKHFGGRGFYNDGTYTETWYEIKYNGKTYYLMLKSTGRFMVRLAKTLDGYETANLAFSQTSFIKQFDTLVKELDTKTES